MVQVTSFNSNVEPEIIPDHNDPYKIEWTDVTENPPYVVGEKVRWL